ncbi:hypothetical protein [Silanimonas sp.]|uniref:hypothetical protein n=1 Tax=Silanimonas sp. TaxID=1929290 RepID=UPI001BC0422F|nr:hypothetical protein [Silanimonas sp.]MBS3895316.1 hypothetical protein [Silanimonas sp.]MBS3923693.1 hypothetical protein [Xanthomonadaceae bacterium]
MSQIDEVKLHAQALIAGVLVLVTSCILAFFLRGSTFALGFAQDVLSHLWVLPVTAVLAILLSKADSVPVTKGMSLPAFMVNAYWIIYGGLGLIALLIALAQLEASDKNNWALIALLGAFGFNVGNAIDAKMLR